MRFLLDTANLENIRYCYEYYPISGVTTNPTIIAKERQPIMPLLKEIRQIIGEERALHVQVIAQKAEDILQEARFLLDQLSGRLYVKIPATEEGIKAIKWLTKEGIPTTATAIFTAQQAHLAALAGASYVAPYVNRIDNLTGNGTGVVEEIVRIFNTFTLGTQVLAASFKNVEQVHQCCLAGAHEVTVDPAILKSLISHPAVGLSVKQFADDWQAAFGVDRLQTD